MKQQTCPRCGEDSEVFGRNLRCIFCGHVFQEQDITEQLPKLGKVAPSIRTWFDEAIVQQWRKDLREEFRKELTKLLGEPWP